MLGNPRAVQPCWAQPEEEEVTGEGAEEAPGARLCYSMNHLRRKPASVNWR